MKIKKKLIWLGLSMSLLAACGAPQNKKSESNEESSGDTVVTGEINADYYRPVLDEDGHYKVSKNRGITLEMNSPTNMRIVEKDLIRLSQESFDAEDYSFQEGQYLPADLVKTWLGRKSEDNDEGLNPAAGGEGDDRVPNYLSTIIEYDFFKEKDERLELAGMTIGLALNSVDYYPKYEYGPIMEQEIDRDTLLKEGKEIANAVVARIRNMDEVGDIPIKVALFEQAAQDDLAGGVFIATGVSDKGSNSVANWEHLNEERLIFPLEGSNTADGNAFSNFQSEVETFFPNTSGLTGRAHYIDDQLSSLQIKVTPHFYGQSEMVAFTQYLHQAASKFLPKTGSVEIIVESLEGVESVLKRDAGEEEYSSYILY